MKTARFLVMVSTLAFFAGFWAACSVGFDPTDPETGEFSCTDDTHCISPFQCKAGVCKQVGTAANCTDADDDGFGTGDEDARGGCRECEQNGRCAEDCNDDDANINPGLIDTCDGKDNNCDEQIDEAVPCEDNFDCPDETPYIASCVDLACVYKAPNQLAGPQCMGDILCVEGERPSPGDECF